MATRRGRMKHQGRGTLISPLDVARRERDRRLIAAAPVELVERDGRVFTLLRLGEAELDRGRVDRVPIVPRNRRAVALA